MPDGSHIVLQEARRRLRPDRAATALFRVLEAGRREQRLVTGLIYVDPATQALRRGVDPRRRAARVAAARPGAAAEARARRDHGADADREGHRGAGRRRLSRSHAFSLAARSPRERVANALQTVLRRLPRPRLVPDRRRRRGRGRRSLARHRGLPRRGQGARAHDPLGARDASPRRLRLRTPRAGGEAPARRSRSARVPRPSTHIARCAMATSCASGTSDSRARDAGAHAREPSFLVYEHAGDERPSAVLTGDTMFVGDVGRVDILSSRLPVEELAGMMYDSLHDKLLTLPTTMRVYPPTARARCAGRASARRAGARSDASGR